MTKKTKRIISFTGMIVFSFVIPALAIMIKYKMLEAFFKADGKIKLSIIGCLIVGILFIVNVKKIKKLLEDMPFSVFKCIVNGVIKLTPLCLLLLVLCNTDTFLSNITYSVSWILGCNAISLFVFEPLYQHFKKESEIDLEYTKWKKREDIKS